MTSFMSSAPRIVISGSFRRHLDGISEAVRLFEALGVLVLSPMASEPLNPGEEFIVLASDDTADPRTLEQRHLDAITAADALYLYNPEGYLGDSAKMELGWANALDKRIFCKEPMTDATLRHFCGTVATP